MEEQILAFVELMGGRGNEELLRPLCQAAEREMAGRLREGLSPEACGPAFPVAAAWLVLAGLEAGTDGVTSFSAGDLTVHTGCLLYTSPSPRDLSTSRMPSSA